MKCLLYDHIKDRRYGTLFFWMFIAFLLATVAASRLRFEWRDEHRILAELIFGLLLAASAVPLMRRFKSRRCKQRAERGTLSSDEIRVARSKLKRRS